MDSGSMDSDGIDYYDCKGISVLHYLIYLKVAEGKLTHQHASTDDTSSQPSKKKRRMATRIEQPRAVAAHFRPADVSSVTAVCNWF